MDLREELANAVDPIRVNSESVANEMDESDAHDTHDAKHSEQRI
jgi:hypothetical protein